MKVNWHWIIGLVTILAFFLYLYQYKEGVLTFQNLATLEADKVPAVLEVLAA